MTICPDCGARDDRWGPRCCRTCGRVVPIVGTIGAGGAIADSDPEQWWWIAPPPDDDDGDARC
jgi:hypothetical protein